MKIKILLITVPVLFSLLFCLIGRESLNIELPKGRESVLVCFGDSLTAGTGAGRGNSYPDHIRQYIDVEIINSGIPGDTTTGAVERLAKDVINHKPDIVIVELGANDYLGGIDVEETEENLNYIVNKLLNEGSIVFIAKFFPEKSIFSFMRSSDKKRYDKIYKTLSKKRNVFLIGDIWKGVWGYPKYMSDSVHPNNDGYRLMADNIFESIKPIFKFNDLIKNTI